jgi:DNA-binding NtrC family response regulator
LVNRIEDLPSLAKKVLAGISGVSPKKISNAGLSILMEHNWPGNIRELKNVLSRACLLSQSKTLKSSDFDFLKELSIADNQQDLAELIPEETYSANPLTEKEWITQALQRNRFKRGPTAEQLGMTTRTLYSKIKKYGIYLA